MKMLEFVCVSTGILIIPHAAKLHIIPWSGGWLGIHAARWPWSWGSFGHWYQMGCPGIQPRLEEQKHRLCAKFEGPLHQERMADLWQCTLACIHERCESPWAPLYQQHVELIWPASATLWTNNLPLLSLGSPENYPFPSLVQSVSFWLPLRYSCLPWLEPGLLLSCHAQTPLKWSCHFLPQS